VSSAEPPSGQQIELRYGPQRAVVVEVGGGLRDYRVADRPVLDGFAVERMADGGRGQPLVPWPNRLADGQYLWDGQQLQLPIDELGRRNASHGLTRWLNWMIAARSSSSVTMRQVIHPRPGYPFSLDVEIDYALADTGLSVRTRAHNRGPRALPYGLGFHPYLTAGTPAIDQALLRLPARAVLEVDERMLPTGVRRQVAGTTFDFRRARLIGTQLIDHCFADLERDPDGLARVSLSAPDDGVVVTLWLDGNFKYVQVFSGDTLAEDRRREGLAIEPMTCPPNAFRSGTDVVRLEPGQHHASAWGVHFDKDLTTV
jgi:aldose 1-epimerase